METRTLGRTGLKLSVLGFGCGAVSGLMTRGAAADQERAVARALELGVNYFDTAPVYGNGESETNLGRILKKLKPNIVLGTKVRLPPTIERKDIGRAIAQSLEASLRRLNLDHVDLFQFHNPISEKGGADTLDLVATLSEVIPAFQRMQQQGKTRFVGITARGDAPVLHDAINAGAIDTAQVIFNLLNPSAAENLPPDFPGQDFGRLFDTTRRRGTGVLVIRVLAGGALGGVDGENRLGVPVPAPIASAADYETDLKRARLFEVLVEEGHAANLAEASTRYAISNPAVTSAIVGFAALDQLEDAAAAVNKGPLPAAALTRIAELQASMAANRI